MRVAALTGLTGLTGLTDYSPWAVLSVATQYRESESDYGQAVVPWLHADSLRYETGQQFAEHAEHQE